MPHVQKRFLGEPPFDKRERGTPHGMETRENDRLITRNGSRFILRPNKGLQAGHVAASHHAQQQPFHPSRFRGIDPLLSLVKGFATGLTPEPSLLTMRHDLPNS